MKIYIGIDFGACNIKAVQVNSSGREHVIFLKKKQDGKPFVPNVILYEKGKKDVESKVGEKAKKSLDLNNKVAQIKPKISQKDWKKYIENLGRDVTAEDVLKDIFAWLWQTIHEKFSKNEDFDVTITAPVSFSEVQKNLIKQAAISVGIPVTGVVTEPFGAMFSLEDFFDKEEQTVLIFDFGGSTLDVSLFKIESADDNLEITELAAAGLKFGGIDIDSEIFDNIISVKYADEVKTILDSGVSKEEIFDGIEIIKETIFAEDEEESDYLFSDKSGGGNYTFALTRDEIISLLEKINIKEKIIAMLDELFDDADIDKSEVTAVKPFGGTSSIDYFLQMLDDYFGKDIIDRKNFEKDEIYMGVAKGAAKYRYMTDKESENVTIHNVVPYSIGLCANQMFSRYIKRNELSGFTTPLKPILISELEKNNWRVAVYQSFSNEFELPQDSEDVIFIGDVQLDKNLYNVKDAILFTMSPDGKGQISMEFLEHPIGNDESTLIEKKIVKVG